jgi:hypothetical protein
MMKGLLLCACLFVAGCTLAPFGDKIEKATVAVVEAGTQDRRAYNDLKAETLLTLPCDISIGAFYRIQNTTKQKALNMLCSGLEPEEPPPALIPLDPLDNVSP